MLDWLVEFSQAAVSSPWFYLAAFAMVALDGLIPLAPGEIVMITGAAYAATPGGPHLHWLLLAGIAGAATGDHMLYGLGRGIAGPLRRWLPEHGRSERWVGAFQRGMSVRGGQVLVATRLLPGARTASTMAAALAGYPLRRFTPCIALAALCWSCYILGLGALGGLTFGDRPLASAGIGILLAVLVGLATELTRRRRCRSRFTPVT